MKTEMDTEPEKYAAEADVPMHILTEELIRKMLRNAFASGMNAGMRIAVQLIKEHQK
jgi:hypothetical protein